MVVVLCQACIGLEVHAQISCRTKLFSSASAEIAYAKPNTRVALVDAAMPGTLPVLNKEAVNQAVGSRSRHALCVRVLLMNSCTGACTHDGVIPDSDRPCAWQQDQSGFILRAEALLLLRPTSGLSDNPAGLAHRDRVRRHVSP